MELDATESGFSRYRMTAKLVPQFRSISAVSNIATLATLDRVRSAFDVGILTMGKESR